MQCTADLNWFLVPSVTRCADGSPRFRMPVPRARIGDAGVRALAQLEHAQGGFHFPLRKFLVRHLAPADVFVDVGAHWGLFALEVLSSELREQVDVLAIEPHPENCAQFEQWMRFNAVPPRWELVRAAAGAIGGDEGSLIVGTTMGHRLAADGEPTERLPRITVRRATLDQLFAERPRLQRRRVLIKIDVEGGELDVLLGARELISGGRVAAIIWEKGHSFSHGSGPVRLQEIAALLERCGFTSFSVPHVHRGGALLPFVGGDEVGDVISVLGRLRSQLDPAYSLPHETPFMLPPDSGRDLALDERVAYVEALRARRGSDVRRWARGAELDTAALERARWAARRIPKASRVLDLGAGQMELQRQLETGCDYRPADVLGLSEHSVELDLNQPAFPAGNFDVVAALAILEHLHDPAWTLQRARVAAPRLVGSYPVCASVDSLRDRRSQGWFNDYSVDGLWQLLDECGWAPFEKARSSDGASVFFACERIR